MHHFFHISGVRSLPEPIEHFCSLLTQPYLLFYCLKVVVLGWYFWSFGSSCGHAVSSWRGQTAYVCWAFDTLARKRGDQGFEILHLFLIFQHVAWPIIQGVVLRTVSIPDLLHAESLSPCSETEGASLANWVVIFDFARRLFFDAEFFILWLIFRLRVENI